MKIVVATLSVLILPLVAWLMVPTLLCLAVALPFTLPLVAFVVMAAWSQREVSATAPSHVLPEPARPLPSSPCVPLATGRLDVLALATCSATCSGGVAPQAGRDGRAIERVAARDAQPAKPTTPSRLRERAPVLDVVLDGV
jgi:hypothetical protein